MTIFVRPFSPATTSLTYICPGTVCWETSHLSLPSSGRHHRNCQAISWLVRKHKMAKVFYRFLQLGTSQEDPRHFWKPWCLSMSLRSTPSARSLLGGPFPFLLVFTFTWSALPIKLLCLQIIPCFLFLCSSQRSIHQALSLIIHSPDGITTQWCEWMNQNNTHYQGLSSSV